MNDLVTIYIPTKNRLPLLKRAIDSIKSQTYVQWELIVVNDASTDGTKEYLDSIKSEKIKVFHQSTSKGACVARNLAINNAGGRFITGLDDDDYFEDNRLKDFINTWNIKPENISILFSGFKGIDANGRILKNVISPYDIVKKKNLLFTNFIRNQVFVETKLLKQVGGFDENLKVLQDFECWYRLLDYSDAFQVKSCSICVDTSDRKDRITLKQKENAKEAYNYFCNKHKLNFKQRMQLKSALIAFSTSFQKFFLRLNKWILLIFSDTFYKFYLSRLIKTNKE